MTPWQNERWACAPENDGKNFAPAHRWAVVVARPLCFGVKKHEVICHLCGRECDWAFTCWVLIPQRWGFEKAAIAETALRSYIREAHELRDENDKLRDEIWVRDLVSSSGPFCNRELVAENKDLRGRIATLEAENAALRGKQPRCPDCGHRLDTEECGCLRADAWAIQTDDDCEAALVRIEKLWGAKTGTPDGDVLDVLLDSVVAYEAAHHLVPEPDKGGDA